MKTFRVTFHAEKNKDKSGYHLLDDDRFYSQTRDMWNASFTQTYYEEDMESMVRYLITHEIYDDLGGDDWFRIAKNIQDGYLSFSQLTNYKFSKIVIEELDVVAESTVYPNKILSPIATKISKAMDLIGKKDRRVEYEKLKAEFEPEGP